VLGECILVVLNGVGFKYICWVLAGFQLGVNRKSAQLM